MANGYILPIQGNEAYVDSNAYITGRDITYESLVANGQLINYSHAFLSTGPVICEQYNAGICFYNSATYRTIARWRVPNISSFHRNFRITTVARGGNGGVNGNIRWSITYSGGTSTINHTPINTVNYAYCNQLNLGLTSANTFNYFEVALSVQNRVDIQSVMVELLPLASPITGTTATNYECKAVTNTFYPMGDLMFTADKPLSSSLARQMSDNITTLTRRQRLIYNHSGLDMGYDSTTNSFNAYTVQPQKGLLWEGDISNIARGDVLCPYWFNSENFDVHFKLDLYVEANKPLFRLYFLDEEINIYPLTTTKWLSYYIKYNASRFDDIVSSSMGTPLIRIAFLPMYPDTEPVNATPILSMSLWGV